jgi:hypothetical protein
MLIVKVQDSASAESPSEKPLRRLGGLHRKALVWQRPSFEGL